MSQFEGVRFDADTYSHIKIEYHDPTDTGRVVSQTFSHPQALGAPLSQARKILSGNNLARISIKREVPREGAGKVRVPGVPGAGALESTARSSNCLQVILLNAGWDTCSRLPVESDVRQVSPSPMGSDSGVESDCADGNLNWLLNYRIRELPPVPGEFFSGFYPLMFH